MDFYKNKRKIINDPVYGFIKITSDLVFELMEHPIFQRLRRIKQLGLTHLVYPGATHTRFQHALGATYLMNAALEVIRSKNCIITQEDYEGALIAILLHDIGHAPFSHALENSIIEGVNHEIISNRLMHLLNREFGGKLNKAIDIFQGKDCPEFLHQLVSSQLDVDRLDYLRRDSFFTGVSEGVIGSERIIKMLHVVDGSLSVEAKGIYSIEKFLIARRLMYWQVYLHKTVVVAEQMLLMVLKRAKVLAENGADIPAPDSLRFFLYQKGLNERLSTYTEEVLKHFIRLDDNDIFSSIKSWIQSDDELLSYLCKSLINRNLFGIKIQNKDFSEQECQEVKTWVTTHCKIPEEMLDKLIVKGSITNSAYSDTDHRIHILNKDGSIIDLDQASDIINVSVLSKKVTKYYLIFPKTIY